MKKRKSVYNSLQELKKTDPSAYFAAKRMGMIDEICAIFDWESHSNTELLNLKWKEKYNLTKEFIILHNRLPRAKEKFKGVQIGSWVNTQKNNYNLNKLSKERIEFLGMLNFWAWDLKEQAFNDHINSLKKFICLYKRLPKSDELFEDFNLGTWVTAQKDLYKNKKLSTERINLLEQIDCWSWSIKKDNWVKKLNALKDFYDLHKRLPVHNERIGDIRIAVYICSLRKLYKNKKLSNKKIKDLESLPFWKWSIAPTWEQSYEIVKEYINKFGYPSPTKNIKYKNINIAAWITTQRRDKKVNRKSLTENRINKLENISGWMWEIKKFTWDEMYALLKEYHEQNPENNFNTDLIFKNVHLGNWVGLQRTNYNRKKITDKQIKLLERLKKWKWAAHKGKWENNLILLKEFIKNNKKLPGQSEKIGKWSNKQRMAFKLKKLSKERIEELEKIEGWYWQIKI